MLIPRAFSAPKKLPVSMCEVQPGIAWLGEQLAEDRESAQRDENQPPP